MARRKEFVERRKSVGVAPQSIAPRQWPRHQKSRTTGDTPFLLLFFNVSAHSSKIVSRLETTTKQTTLFFFAIFCGKRVKIVPVRDGQTGKGAGKLLKPAFGPCTVPLAHIASLLVRDDRSGKTPKQQQRNNKKCLRACSCVCMPFSGYKISPWLWHYRPCCHGY